MATEENVYGNVSPLPSMHLSDKTPSNPRKRCSNSLVTALTLLLFTSLFANVFLAYMYYTSNITLPPSKLPSQIRTCSSEQFSEHQIYARNSLYIFSNDGKTWEASRKRCQELGGDLAIIKSKEEQDFLANKVASIGNSKLHWIGLTDAENEGTWLWVDQTPLMENLSWWHYTPDDWKAHDPLGEDCAVYFDGEWADVSCLTSERRICEIPCTNSTLHVP